LKTFTDSTGRPWTLSLTLGTAMAVRDQLGVDLLQPESPRKDDPGGEPLLTRLGTDEILLGEVLCVMLADQFERHQLSPAQVHAAFDGPTLLAAQQAFYEELIDFFRGRGRHDRAKAVAKQMAMIQAAIEAIETRIDALDPRNVVEQTIRGGTSGDLPAASASAQSNSSG